MFRLGAHVSIANGYLAAVEREVELGGNCGQLFVGSPRGWATSEIDPDEAAEFQEATAAADVGPWIVHGTYLINLATPKDDLAEKSVGAVQAEVDAAARLDIPYYVFHPGAHTGAGEQTGIQHVGERLSAIDVPEPVTILLENTAGRGTTVGTSIADLNTMIQGSSLGSDDLGVCLDTCHLFAAGYDISLAGGIAGLIEEIESTVGLDAIQYLHLNDSRHPLGSNKDEHEDIGQGLIGTEGFRRFINHDAMRSIPMVLETPDDGNGYAWNIDTLAALRTGD